MKYMLLLYADERQFAEMPGEQFAAILAEHEQYGKDLREAGAYVGGDALQDSSTATSLRLQNGSLVVTDGPFAETKEQLGGYYIIEAADLDEAMQWARRNPELKRGTIEIRPIHEFEA